MSGRALLEELEEKENNAKKIAEAIIKDESLVGAILEGVRQR